MAMRALFLASLLALSACVSAPLRPLAEGGAPVAVTTRPISLDPAQPERTILGRLRYLGGIEIESSDRRIGGFSSLKHVGGRLYTVTDVGDWAIIDTVEQGDRLLGAEVAAMGDLSGLNGALLQGTDTGDAEGLAFDGHGWLVSFEHQHKILRYPALGGAAQPSGLDPAALFGALGENNGVETIAARGGRAFLCAERLPTQAMPNCYVAGRGRTEPVDIPAPPSGLDPKTAFPVDADWARDGTLYILMRSWSGGNDNRVALYQRRPDGALRVLATFLKPLALDNYEGLALREEQGRTFLYIISDDNFRQYNDPGKPETWQRTLLLKFELLG